MSWIRVIEDAEADGELREVYEAVANSRGKIASILRVHSLIPRTLAAHLELYESIQFATPGLPRRTRELIATVVSKANDCEYCTRHHAEALNAYLKDSFLVDAIVEDPHGASLDSKDRAAVDFALKLTREPGSMTEEDVELLHAAGFTDEDVLSVTLVTGYFNFVNRIALALGVRFDDDEARGYRD